MIWLSLLLAVPCVLFLTLLAYTWIIDALAERRRSRIRKRYKELD